MTLLEAMVALVILGLSGVGFLEAFHQAAHTTRDAQTWVTAVEDAEAAMEETKLGVPSRIGGLDAGDAPAHDRTVDVRPWSGAPGVDLVTVTVPLPGGGSFVLRRLARVR